MAASAFYETIEDPVSKPWTPHAYQKKAVKFMIQQGAAGLFLDPGLGKTSITLGALKILKRQGMMSAALIIAPLRVAHSVWPAEVTKWTDFKDLKVVVLHGSKKELALKEKADIYVINPEGLDWLLTDNRFRQLGADVLVIDESSKFKHTGTRRFKALRPILSKFRRRYILTGTPAPNGLLDLFGQIFILDLGRSFGPYITKFKRDFFDPTGFGGYTFVPKEGTQERIQDLIKPLVMRLDGEDLLELPEIVYNNIYVDLPPHARKVYEELEEEMITQLESLEIVTAMSAAAASLKCRQVANGGIFLQREVRGALASDRWEDLHNEKVIALADLAEELNGQPLFVAYDFEHDRERIRKHFPKAIIASDYSAKRFVEIEKAWNQGKIEMLCGHPASLGHGLNLQDAGQHVVWHSMTWDLELYDQFIRRVRRQGNQHSQVFVHHILARGTVDLPMLRALRRKGGVQSRLLDALKEIKKARGK